MFGIDQQGAFEFSKKSMHSYLWRVGIRKDRKYKVCPPGGIRKNG
jgi:hypothetical protein